MGGHSSPKEEKQVSHFADRCKENGIDSSPGNILAAAIRWEVKHGVEGDKVERVMAANGGRDIYRFRVPEGIFYAVIGDDDWPVTLYTQEIVRQKKRARRTERRRRRWKK